ncbi:MAG TPA: hypothetical protein VHU92_20115 [Streptosporangiaceae bacterium]|nr:hypothetical protein [Streptosporangiaceae bacterium]
MSVDPFAALGLVASPELTDDEVRAAWRRLAAATHPDRADGGDPAVFAVAAGAYSELRTRAGRGEALADRGGPASGRMASGGTASGGTASGGTGGWAWRVGPGWRGRARRAGFRVAAAGGLSVLAVVVGGWQPATVALMVGALTWVMRAR